MEDVLLASSGLCLLRSVMALRVASLGGHISSTLSERGHSSVAGNANGVNVIGLALQGPSVPGLQLVQGGAGRPHATIDMGFTYQHPLQARGPTREYATNKGKSTSLLLKKPAWK
jgi:hypothetical protein